MGSGYHREGVHRAAVQGQGYPVPLPRPARRARKMRGIRAGRVVRALFGVVGRSPSAASSFFAEPSSWRPSSWRPSWPASWPCRPWPVSISVTFAVSMSSFDGLGAQDAWRTMWSWPFRAPLLSRAAGSSAPLFTNSSVTSLPVTSMPKWRAHASERQVLLGHIGGLQLHVGLNWSGVRPCCRRYMSKLMPCAWS